MKDWKIKFLTAFGKANDSSPSGWWWQTPTRFNKENESNPQEVIKWIESNILEETP